MQDCIFYDYQLILSRFISKRANADGLSDIYIQIILLGLFINNLIAAGFFGKVNQSILSGLFSNKCIAAGFSDNDSQSTLSRLFSNNFIAVGSFDTFQIIL